jgi:predicted MFS family arabinose efflux permease
MGLLALLGIAALLVLIPRQKDHASLHPKIDLKAAWQRVLQEKTTRGALAFIFLVSAANDNLFVAYGAWMEKSFGLGIVTLGLGTSAIGLAELLGETLTATLADRIGLKRSVMIGLALCIIFYAMLPFVGQTITMAFVSLFLIFVAFEFMMVTSVSMATELLPEARATMMATYMGAAGLGRAVGALIGGPVWLTGGIFATGLVSAFISALALGSLWWGLQGWEKN